MNPFELSRTSEKVSRFFSNFARPRTFLSENLRPTVNNQSLSAGKAIFPWHNSLVKYGEENIFYEDNYSQVDPSMLMKYPELDQMLLSYKSESEIKQFYEFRGTMQIHPFLMS